MKNSEIREFDFNGSPISFIEKSRLFPNLLLDLVEDYSPDGDFNKILEEQRKAPQDLPVNKNLVEQNISDVGTLLDRLLGLRRELTTLDAERTKTMLAYTNALNLAACDKRVELAKAVSPTPELEAAIQDKFNLTADYIKDLERRHGLPGSSINFAQRIEKIRELIRRDAFSLAARIITLQYRFNGVEGIQRILFPSPANRIYARFDGAGYLDDLVGWHRRLSRAEESRASFGKIDECIISLGLGTAIQLYDGNGEPTTVEERIPAPSLLQDIRVRNEISFRLGNVFYSDDFLESFGQLRGLAVSVAGPPGQDYWRYQINVTAPFAQDSILVVSNAYPGPVNWVVDNSFLNTTAVGKWRIKIISASTIYPGLAGSDTWPILDVKLHLKIRNDYVFWPKTRF